MAKKKLTLSIDEEKIKQLKKIAIDNGITLSDYLYNSGVTVSQMKLNNDSNEPRKEA